MKTVRNKFYRDGSFHHIYEKSINGNVLFYRTEDYLFFYTLFSVLTRRYHIITEAFCIMFNHYHACSKARTHTALKAFLRDLSSTFTKGYNEEYGLTGKLLVPCGYVPKTSGKLHRSCLIYIVNNPAAGKLVKSAIMYKWNLLAYLQSDHPFSEKLVKRNCRFKMRNALALVDGSFKRWQSLNYKLLERVFDGLNQIEKAQITDYIIVKYFFMDKSSFISHFGSLDNALSAIYSTSGSENDFYEPWEDYSPYLSMLLVIMKQWKRNYRFHEMPVKDLMILRRKLSSLPGATKMHVERFLRCQAINDGRDLYGIDSKPNKT